MTAMPVAAAGPADATTSLRLGVALDLTLTMAPVAHGRGDPTFRWLGGALWRTTIAPAGPATLRIHAGRGRVDAAAWGPGAAEALEGVPALIGLTDDPAAFRPDHPLLADLVRRHPGLRLPRTGRVFEALLPAICEQKVTGDEARAAFRAIVQRWGAPPPGPAPVGMRVPPDPGVLAAVPYHAFHPLGLERRRAEVVRRAATIAGRLELAQPAEAARRMLAIPGIGPWTVAEVARVAHGDPDAVSVGDYHIPNLVAWALAGEPRADDARMLELLEPFRGQRGRVQRLLEVSGIRAPRYGPRMAPRSIREI